MSRLLKRSDLAGSVLDDFELVKRIGMGYSGDVYEAIYRPNGKRFALKLLDVEANAGERRRFHSEFKVLSTLEIKGLVRAYHFGQVDGRIYFSTDLLTGHNFETYLREHRNTPPEQAIVWVLQICKVVQALHNHGVLHRDLKPGNMQLDDQGELTVFDLGSCKCTPKFYAETDRCYITGPEDRHVTGASARRNLCTPGYLAPEATRAEPSPSIDIYSIGAILHRILFGHTPDSTLPEIIRAREALEPEELAIALECAIAEDPTERYQSLEELIRELDFALEMVRLELGIEPELGSPSPVADNPPVEDADNPPARPVEDADNLPVPVPVDDDNPPSAPPVEDTDNPSAPPRRLRIRRVATLGLMFLFGWSFAQVTLRTVQPDTGVAAQVVPQEPKREAVVASDEAGELCATAEEPKREAVELVEHEGVPDEAGELWATAEEPSRGEVEEPSKGEVEEPSKGEVEEPSKGGAGEPSEAEARLSQVASQQKTDPKPRGAKTGQAKGKRTFERDLVAQMEGCQIPSQTVSYRIRNGELERLKFEHPPGSVQRDCVTVGLSPRYGSHNFTGTVSHEGSTP